MGDDTILLEEMQKEIGKLRQWVDDLVDLGKTNCGDDFIDTEIGAVE